MRFLAEGVDGASLREIARDAGTNIGMIVYYFPTKDDLFLAVVEGVYAGIVEDLTRLLAVDAPARERLREAFVRLGHSSDLELEVIQLVLREALSSSNRMRRILARAMRGHIPLLLSTIADGIESSEFDENIPAPLILVVLIALGAAPQLARRASHAIPIFAGLPPVEALADLSIKLITKAVGAPRRRTPTVAAGRVKKAART